ncbi:MAG: cation:proton antiporter [Candidatus Omnitrophica bacterium]|nr:cation:proton antiporter [Candidatus Omnitrophota bacterium]MCM8768610.1 cation:proton antiporter [Candidatus Omnitrophota bacterium]
MITFIFAILVVCSFLCLFRISRGPTPADRTVAMDILGIVIVAFCALSTVLTHQDYYINIALAWALLNFIGTLALAKFLEGRGFDE